MFAAKIRLFWSKCKFSGEKMQIIDAFFGYDRKKCNLASKLVHNVRENTIPIEHGKEILPHHVRQGSMFADECYRGNYVGANFDIDFDLTEILSKTSNWIKLKQSVLPGPCHHEDGRPMAERAEDDEDVPDAMVIAMSSVVDKEIDTKGIDDALCDDEDK